MARKSCKDCAYCDSLGPLPVDDGEREYVGRCRHNPPLPSIGGYAVFPIVTKNDWCGKFKKAKE